MKLTTNQIKRIKKKISSKYPIFILSEYQEAKLIAALSVLSINLKIDEDQASLLISDIASMYHIDLNLYFDINGNYKQSYTENIILKKRLAQNILFLF